MEFAFHRILSFQKLKTFYQPKGLKQLTIVKTSPKSYQKQYLGRFKVNKMQIMVKIEVLFEKTHMYFPYKTWIQRLFTSQFQRAVRDYPKFQTPTC